MEWAVEVEDMTVAYTTKPVLWDVDMKVPIGSLAAIVGPNGAGKSTLLKAMLGLLTVISGSVKFYIDHHLAMDKKDYKKIAYVPQSGSVDWDFPTTVLDVVLMGRYGHLGWFKRPSKKDKELALSMIEKMGMSDYVNRQIRQLSGANNSVYSLREPSYKRQIFTSWTSLSRASIKRRSTPSSLFYKK